MFCVKLDFVLLALLPFLLATPVGPTPGVTSTSLVGNSHGSTFNECRLSPFSGCNKHLLGILAASDASVISIDLRRGRQEVGSEPHHLKGVGADMHNPYYNEECAHHRHRRHGGETAKCGNFKGGHSISKTKTSTPVALPDKSMRQLTKGGSSTPTSGKKTSMSGKRKRKNSSVRGGEGESESHRDSKSEDEGLCRQLVFGSEDDEDGREVLSACIKAGGAKAVKRSALICSSVAASEMCTAAGPACGPQGPKTRVTDRGGKALGPFNWVAHCDQLTEAEFKTRYRLDLDSFNTLLDKCRADLTTNNTQKAWESRPHSGPISPEVRLACTLRYLAGGQVCDLRLIYKPLSKSECYKCVWAGVDAINKHITVCFPIDDLDKLCTIEAGFRAASKDEVWRGCVGAVDGCHFKMQNPGRAVDDPQRYHVARKGCYALLFQAVCDVDRRFTYWDCSYIPRTHDSLAFEGSELGMKISEGKLDKKFFLNGDSAYNAGDNMVTPTSGTRKNDDFNFFQSSNRMPIECAFGILIRRWGILWKSLEMEFKKRAPVVSACMRLHNFCIDRRIEFNLKRDGRYTLVNPGRWSKTPKFDKKGRPVAYLNWNRSLRGAAGGTHTEGLTKRMEDKGLVRPRRRNKRNKRTST